MRTMLDVRDDICGALCATGKEPNGMDAEALEATLAACPADAVARIAELEARLIARMQDVVDAAILWASEADGMWMDLAAMREEQTKVVGEGPIERGIKERHMTVERELREAVKRYRAGN